ncbi:MAG: glycerate kinase [Acidobacteriota bacterium]|nr:MAG: glycerate kinase [Acidobacteriota bacterium]
MVAAHGIVDSPTYRNDLVGFAHASALGCRSVTQELEALFLKTLDRIALTRVVPEKVHCRNGFLWVGGEAIELDRYDRLWGVAFGKAGFQMAEAMLDILSPRPLSGIVSGTAEIPGELAGFSCFRGGHPYPNRDSFRTGESVLELLDNVAANDLVIYLLSGGGSAICEKPLFPEISLADCRAFYERLVTCGANIIDVNFVRKHFSAIKGGRLAERAWPARQITLYVSDAPPDSASNVASGPTMPDESTVEDCYAILDELGVVSQLPASIRDLVERRQIPETPKPSSASFQTCSWHCLLSPEEAVHALSAEAARGGFQPVIDWSVHDDTPLDEATGRLLRRLEALRSAHPGKNVAVVAGGEFSCPVEGRGIGGRNQAFVLGCIPAIAGKNIAVLSAGTDGIDGISPAAGAVADGDSLGRARQLGLDVSDYARRSDSHSFFARLGDAITIGPTGNNVRDLRILVAWP